MDLDALGKDESYGAGYPVLFLGNGSLTIQYYSRSNTSWQLYSEKALSKSLRWRWLGLPTFYWESRLIVYVVLF